MSETIRYRPLGLLNVRAVLWTVPARLAVVVGATYVVLAQSPGAREVQHRARPAFDPRRAIVPLDEGRAGGPPKDGIPALTDPPTVQPASADYLNPGDRVAGVALDARARAYPLKILNYHEIVDDRRSSLAQRGRIQKDEGPLKACLDRLKTFLWATTQ